MGWRKGWDSLKQLVGEASSRSESQTREDGPVFVSIEVGEAPDLPPELPDIPAKEMVNESLLGPPEEEVAELPPPVPDAVAGLEGSSRAPDAPGMPEVSAPLPDETEAEEVPLYWDQIPAVVKQHRRMMTGGEPGRYGNFVNYALVRWGGSLRPQPLRALLLGAVAKPPLADFLLQSGRVREVVVADREEELADNATHTIDDPVEYSVCALGEESLPEGPFDMIVAYESLHRARYVDRLFDHMMDVLVPGGLLVLRDYVGPNRLQFPEQQMALVNALLALLPTPLRTDVDGVVQTRQAPPDRHWLARLDQNKAVCSEAILKELRLRFKILEFQPLGGTLLGPLLVGLAGNFCGTDQEAAGVLDALMAAEMKLIQGKLMPSDHCFAIARRP